MIDLRLPNMTGVSEREQLSQLKACLFQWAEQLNLTLNSLDSGVTSSVERYVSKNALLREESKGKVDATATFNAIKGLIIKSADIVTAYYEEIEKKLSSIYVAESDFGTYKQSIEQSMKATSDSITQGFTDVQEITTDLDIKIGGVADNVGTINDDLNGVKGNVDNLAGNLGTVSEEVGKVDDKISSAKDEISKDIEAVDGKINNLDALVELNTDYRLLTQAYIKSGMLYTDPNTGRDVYGIEIGQTDDVEVDGATTQVFNKFARFTADMLSFYDPKGSTTEPVAYISGNKLYIPNAEITVSLQIGGYVDIVTAGGGVITKWVGLGD